MVSTRRTMVSRQIGQIHSPLTITDAQARHKHLCAQGIKTTLISFSMQTLHTTLDSRYVIRLRSFSIRACCSLTQKIESAVEKEIVHTSPNLFPA